MSFIKEIDYHIELTSIRDFSITLLENNSIPIDGKQIFDTLKKAVINSEVAPFYRKPLKEVKDEYYEKYIRLEIENNELNLIPDFYFYNGDIYDLNKKLNFNRPYINDNTFKLLFTIKLLELNHSKGNIKEFLNFQLYDNYYGEKENFGYFLLKIIEKDSNSHLLPSITSKIQQWIVVNKLEILSLLQNSNEVDEQNDEELDSNLLTKDIWENKRNFEIIGKLSIDEIRHYFSFLYIEVVDKKKPKEFKPFLSKEEVDMIFKNGLVIPSKPIENMVKLSTEPRFPKKIVDYAIHKFFTLNSFTLNDKKDYILFFANYIEDYKNALISKDNLNDMAKNITGENSRRNKIRWEEYIPK